MQNLQSVLQELPTLHLREWPIDSLPVRWAERIIALGWLEGLSWAQVNPRLVRQPRGDLWDFLGQSLLWWIGLLLALLILAGVVYLLRSWWQEDAGRMTDSRELLSQFRELHREGDLTHEEFRSIKSRLAASAAPDPAPDLTVHPGDQGSAESDAPPAADESMRSE